jgi:hypothetical protein
MGWGWGWAGRVEGDSTPHDPHRRLSHRSPTFPHLHLKGGNVKTSRVGLSCFVVVAVVVVFAGT